MILLDTGPIVAWLDASDRYHRLCTDVLKSIDEPLTTTWSVVTEAFYLLGFSWKAQDSLWELILRGAVEIVSLDFKMQGRCRALMQKYKDLPMDLADATLVALAESHRNEKVFTLDHKDFEIYRYNRNKKFKILPARI